MNNSKISLDISLVAQNSTPKRIHQFSKKNFLVDLSHQNLKIGAVLELHKVAQPLKEVLQIDLPYQAL